MSKQTTWPKYDVLGVEIDAVTIADATAYIVERAADPSAPACYVVKPYSEFIDRAVREPRVKAYLNEAELALPDGVALCWATVFRYGGGRHWWRIITSGASIVIWPRSAYQFLPQKFAGANATWALLAAAEAANLRLYLVGTPKSGNLEHTKAAIAKHHPKLQIVGSSAGTLANIHGHELRAAVEAGSSLDTMAGEINDAKPDLILVGMGFPLQEAVMSRLIKLVPHGVFIGEGGTFDYDSFGGSVRRAPRFLQNIGLEWLWRLILDPRRIKRQLAIPRLIWRVYRDPRT